MIFKTSQKLGHKMHGRVDIKKLMVTDTIKDKEVLEYKNSLKIL